MTPLGVTMRVELDEIVDMRFRRRVMAAGARDDPAAERRELKTLGIVAQRQPLRTELILQRGPVDASTDPCRATRAVDFVNFVEAFEIERNRRGISITNRRFNATDHARPAADRNDGDIVAASPIENGDDLFFVLGKSDEIRRIRHIAHPHSQNVGKGSAVSMQKPVVRRRRETRCQRRRRFNARLTQIEVAGFGRRTGRKPITAGKLARACGHSILFCRRQLIIVIAPAPKLARSMFRESDGAHSFLQNALYQFKSTRIGT